LVKDEEYKCKYALFIVKDKKPAIFSAQVRTRD
jgi:hypothetical protein